MGATATILYADLDAFYGSVEQLLGVARTKHLAKIASQVAEPSIARPPQQASRAQSLTSSDALLKKSLEYVPFPFRWRGP